jgi:hypothetical protein
LVFATKLSVLFAFERNFTTKKPREDFLPLELLLLKSTIMKSLIKVVACVFFVEIIIFVSCKKDSTGLVDNHLPPVAKAGADTSVHITSCASSNFIGLDGSHSFDPDYDIVSYLWTKISGPSTGNILNYTSAVARLVNFLPGQYALELKVTDAGSRSSKDTVRINVTGPGEEYDLDVTINTGYSFYNNYEDCYYYYPCAYYDMLTIQANFNFPPIGEFNFYASEFADTAIGGHSQGANMNLYAANGNNPGVWGASSISFKHLIEQGGGSFSGTFKVDGGSAQDCNQRIFDSVPPLAVTGNLDTTTHAINIRIKGKTYF